MKNVAIAHQQATLRWGDDGAHRRALRDFAAAGVHVRPQALALAGHRNGVEAAAERCGVQLVLRLAVGGWRLAVGG